MIKAIRRIAAVIALLVVAVRGALSFLSWVEKQDEVQEVWTEDEELEEAF
jgi:Tfp pilus assembly protein PilO